MTDDLTLAVAGDIFFESDGRLTADYKLIEKDHPSVWLHRVAPVLQGIDFVQGNLEGAACQSVPVADLSESNILSMRPVVCDMLKEAGFHAVTLANNHAMDFGAEGILQTLAHLDRVGIAHAGAGRNIAEARKPAILERGGVRHAILSYCSIYTPGRTLRDPSKPGIVTIPVRTSYEIPPGIVNNPGALPRVITTPDQAAVEKMREEVRLAKTQADVVVVNFHWGLTPRGSWPTSGIPVKDRPFYVLNYQEDLGRSAIDVGADLVVGHHPHRLQGVESYKGKVICYSLGNLTMGYSLGANGGEEAILVKAYIDRGTRRLSKVHLIPIMVPDKTMEPELVQPGEVDGFLSGLAELSSKYGTRLGRSGDEIVVEAQQAPAGQ